MGRDDLERLARLTEGFFQQVPLNRAMGMEILELGEGRARMRLPWDPRWLADPVSGRVHGGVPAALLDATCGMAAFMGLDPPSAVATLDLRLDHLRPLEAGKPVEAIAEVVQATPGILFVRGRALQGEGEPAVLASATFAVTP